MVKGLENTGLIVAQLVKKFSFAVEEKFSLLLSQGFFNGRNKIETCEVYAFLFRGNLYYFLTCFLI
jgi:hypothetical protein